MNDPLPFLCSNPRAAANAVLATLVNVEGSSYRRAGARMLLTNDRQRIGAISGGCLEEDVIARTDRVSLTGTAELVTYDTTSENDLVWGVGLGCHGVVQVLIEKLPATPRWLTALAENRAAHRSTELAVVYRAADPLKLGTRLAAELAESASTSEAKSIFFNTVRPPQALVVFGAGDDAVPLVRLAKQMGWHVTVADPRSAFVAKERFAGADRLVCAPSEKLVEKTPLHPGSFVVVMTHHYVHDVPILRDLLSQSAVGYIGLLGPKKRAERIFSDLSKTGAPVGKLDRGRLHAPVGLDLGSETPEEVALSMLAEMQAFSAGRDARPLRLRDRPIHA